MFSQKFDIIQSNLTRPDQKFQDVVTKLCSVTKLPDLTVIVSGNFLPWLSAICVFFAVFYLLQDGGSKLLCSDGAGDPLHALFEGALGQQVACQL